MDRIFQYLKGDKVIWIITLFLLAISMVSVYSFIPVLVKQKGGTPFGYLFKHLIYIGLSLGVMYWVHRKDPKYFSRLSKVGYYLAILLLLYTVLLGMTVNDAARWVSVPVIGLTFQSSDFARLALIVYLSRLLVKKKDDLNSWKEGFKPLMIPIVVVCGLVFKDNFSTAAMIFSVCLVMLFLGKLPWKQYGAILGGVVALVGVVVLVHISFPDLNLLPRWDTWTNRIQNKGAEEKNIIANAQALNAELAIYNGRPKPSNGFGLGGGQGVGAGDLKEYIPEAYADFFYASFVEEFGIIYAFALILLYLILLYRIIRIGVRSNNLFYSYVCIGIGVLILIQATVNMMVCTGIFPVTGQNMPLLSKGGSALIMTCLSLGMVQAIAIKQEEAKEK